MTNHDTKLKGKNILICDGWTPYPDNSVVKGGTMKSTPEMIHALRDYGVNITYRTILGESTCVINEDPTEKRGGFYYRHVSEQEQLNEILSNKYDLVHISSRIIFNKQSIVNKLKEGLKTPIIWTLTGPAVLSEVEKEDLELCSAITCLSSGLKQQCVLLGIPEEKLFIIPNVVNVNEEKRPDNHQEIKAEIRSTHNVPHDAIVFTYAGRISPEKKLDTLVDTWKKFFEAHHDKNQYLFILGGVAENNQTVGQKNIPDSPMQKLFKYIRSLSEHNIISTGWADIHPYMIASDFAVSTASMEGLSNVALEAATREVPNIAPIGTHGYIDIIENKVSGFLYNLWEEDGLLNAFHEAYKLKKHNSDKYIEMSKAARQRVIDYSSPEKVYIKYINLYKNILSL